MFGRKEKTAGNSDIKEDPPKPKGTLIGKVGIIGSNVLFFVLKDRKKRWVAIKEIPIQEITSIDNFGNKLSVAWKGVTDTFFVEKNAEFLGGLCDQINWMLEEQRKPLESTKKVALLRSELLGAVNASIEGIDASFDVLIRLQDRRIDWRRLEVYCNSCGKNLGFTGKIVPPLSLDFSNISLGVKRQVAEETSKEAYNILKVIYAYFNCLNLDFGPEDNQFDLKNAKDVISAYFALNDILLGKVVGEKENKKESNQLEMLLQKLSNETNFKVNTEKLKGTIDSVGPDDEMIGIIEHSRGIFKERLKQF